MALARIFSRSPEQTTALSQQLEQQGYTVEVLSPDDAPTTVADLEIQLEVCDPADVLRRAAELAARLQCDVAVAPGTLQTGLSPVQASAAPSVPEEQAPAAILPVGPATSGETAVPPLHPIEMQPPSHEAPGFELYSQGVLSRAARSLGAALAACAVAADQLMVSARDQFRESWELTRIGFAEAHARREERLLDLTRRRAEAQQHALELKTGRRTLAAYLLRLQQENPGAFPDAVSLSPGDAAPLAVPAASRWKIKTMRIRFHKREAAVAGTAAAGVLLGIGLAVASFHSRPILSANPGTTLPPAVVAPTNPAPKATSPARPSPALHKASVKPADHARQAKLTTTKRTTPQRKTSQRDQNLVATDVTVRHFPTPRPTPRPQAEGWKHFSDMSN